MNVKVNDEFFKSILSNLSFTPFEKDNYIVYKNQYKPELGYILEYSYKGYYSFGIGDYTIPKDFSLSFNNTNEIMKFGTLYTGKTNVKLENNNISSFTPSSFFVIEKDIKGCQTWKKGQHYHGAEITIYKKYFEEVLYNKFPSCIKFDDFLSNYTYKYLPLEIVSIIQQLTSLSGKNLLNSIYLESKILECIAILTNEVLSSPNNAFTNQLDYGEINIGKNRKIKLKASDINAIQKAHDILTKDSSNPPTISNLSKQVFLNEQKLKAGFTYYYHMSIGEYTTSLRMTKAANLLSTTDLSIEEISNIVGYNYSGNFSKMFKKTYNKTPFEFRNKK